MKDGQTIGQWLNWDFEANGNLVIRDNNGNLIYWENSDGFWEKHEFDFEGNELYYQNKNGEIIDNRPKPSRELTLESLAEDVLKLSELVTRFVNQVNESNTIK
jgi:hypothetical protein